MSSISTILSAAAPLQVDLHREAEKKLSCDIKQAWGMSELSPLGTIESDFNLRAGSIGNLCSDTMGKVVDVVTGDSLGPNRQGELMIKGPQVMIGYYNDTTKTKECLSSDGWLQTGDMAEYDRDGFFYITDRIKELIKVRGYQVAPTEFEALLLTHPDIIDAAVIPVQDDGSGELPRAYYITLNKNQDSEKITAVDIKEWDKENVAPYKRLEGGVELIEQVPKSASGKILRRLLRDKYIEKFHSKDDAA